ncbi:hypothetical protein KP509_16G005400 [Ceratopteris richardii]|uniref:Uncharacterized protein n=1 Tax=Ceratopteris richardii TaxID=49495 RepID=A0A8T2SZA5_CERRI|nr:hypothetical protein KP509_16G005400 [Ceratopteris richardii]
MIPRKPSASKETMRSSVFRGPQKVNPPPPPVNKSSDLLKPALDPPQQERKGFWNWRPFRAAAQPSATVAPEKPQRLHVLYSLHVHSIQNLPASLNGLRLIVHWNRQEEGLQTMPSRVVDGVVEFDETLRQRCTVFGSRSPKNLMQYDPKLFALSVVALDVDELELGKHHIDLSRLLPEEHVDRNSQHPNHNWSTSFELSSMAKGGSLFVTFSYDILHQETSEEDSESKIRSGGGKSVSSQENLRDIPHTSLSAVDMDFRKGQDMEGAIQQDKESNIAVDTHVDASREPQYADVDEDESMFMKDLSPDLDEEIDLVTDEFLNMLDFGFSPDSLEAGQNKYNQQHSGGGFDSHVGRGSFADDYDLDDDLELSSIMEAAESELQKAAQSARSKSRAQELEDEETQALMKRWGLNENAIRSTPEKPMFGPHLRRPPPLAKGLGSVLQLEDGGSLRSMNPSIFPKHKAAGSLVMQSSKPVVVPSGMGSNAVDVLRHLASLGSETLSKQAMAAMPLEDVTKIADNLVAKQSTSSGRDTNAAFSGFGRERRDKTGGYDDYVSLEDLAPLAMQNIETLALDGLKIQADVAEEAPSYLDAAAWGMIPDMKRIERDKIQLSHGVAGMHMESFSLENVDSSDAIDSGPLSMALTIEEWSKLDAGIVDGDEKSKEKSLAIMAAHNADMRLTKGRKGGNMGNTLMIAVLVQLRDPLQNFEAVGAPMLTLIQAERVMLPPKPRMGRNVSATGDSEVDDELAETTAKKEEVPQFKLTGIHMSGLKTSEDSAPSLKGLEATKKGWGSQKQLQSGSRWLAAQGMGKSSKPSLLKGKAVQAPSQTKVKPGETLWSISARLHGSGNKWRDLAAMNPHIRNPDVILPNETIIYR